MPVNFNPRPPLSPLGRDTRFALPPSLDPMRRAAADIDPAIAREIPPWERPGFSPETDMPPPPTPTTSGLPPGWKIIDVEGTKFLLRPGTAYPDPSLPGGIGYDEDTVIRLNASSERVSPYETANAQFDLAQRMRGIEAMVDTPWGKMTAQEAAAARSSLLPPPPTLAEQTAANVEQERQLREAGLGGYYQGPPTEYQQGLLSEQRLSREQTTANQARQAELEQWRQQGWRPGSAQEVAAYYASLDKLRRFYGGG